MDTIKLGEKCRDSVTGFEGVATAHCRYVVDNDRVCLESVADGKPVEVWLDINRIEPVAPATAD